MTYKSMFCEESTHEKLKDICQSLEIDLQDLLFYALPLIEGNTVQIARLILKQQAIKVESMVKEKGE